jgi:hypothetical protein
VVIVAAVVNQDVQIAQGVGREGLKKILDQFSVEVADLRITERSVEDEIVSARLINCRGAQCLFHRQREVAVAANALFIAQGLLHGLAEAARAFERRPPAEPEQAAALQLSLAPANYVGVYENSHWGTFRIDQKDGQLAAALGDLPLQLKSTGIDHFDFRGGPTSWAPANFELEGAEVQRALLKIPGYDRIAFVRQ